MLARNVVFTSWKVMHVNLESETILAQVIYDDACKMLASVSGRSGRILAEFAHVILRSTSCFALLTYLVLASPQATTRRTSASRSMAITIRTLNPQLSSTLFSAKTTAIDTAFPGRTLELPQ
jgi:hypothetical protein